MYWIPVILNYSVWSSLNADGMETGHYSRKKYRSEKEKYNIHMLILLVPTLVCAAGVALQ